MSNELHMSTIFFPQLDGQSKRTIKILKDMLRVSLLDCAERWDHNFPLVKFAYNNDYHTSISVAAFEALYG